MRPRSDPGQSPDALISSASARMDSRSIFLRACQGLGRISLMGTMTFMTTPPPVPAVGEMNCLVSFYHAMLELSTNARPRAKLFRQASSRGVATLVSPPFAHPAGRDPSRHQGG